MNREIKFRAWCDKGNAMVTPCEVYTQEDGSLYTRTRYQNDLGYHYNIHGNLMQYTGLKDKTGQEIYEGDIFQVISKTTPPRIMDKFLIEINPKCGVLNGWGSYQGTVIGNIYANPELLHP